MPHILDEHELTPTALLGKLSVEDENLISIREVLVCMMREFGGPAEFARMFKADFDEHPIGAPARMTAASRLLAALERFGAEENNGPDATPEDLEAQLARLLQGTFAQAALEAGVSPDTVDTICKRMLNADD